MKLDLPDRSGILVACRGPFWRELQRERAARERAVEVVRALDALMEKPAYASREALDQWRSMTRAFLASLPESQGGADGVV